MIPASQSLIINIESAEKVTLPSLTFRIDFDKCRIQGFSDDAEALRQDIFCRLMTERGSSPIFSEKYGLPMNELIGQNTPLVYVSVASAITETLLEDDRILNVYGFIFDTDREKITVTFNIDSVFGKTAFEEVTL